MPREQINFPDLDEKARQLELRALADGKPPSAIEDKYGFWNEASLHVGWNPISTDEHSGFGWVQVALEADLNYVAFSLANPNGATDDRTVMWTPALTEPELDRLIDMLTRAKRKAFGSVIVGDARSSLTQPVADKILDRLRGAILTEAMADQIAAAARARVVGGK